MTTSHTPRRARLVAALALGASGLLCLAAPAHAQSVPGALAKRAAQNAVAATNAHTNAMTSPNAGGLSVTPTTIPGQAPTAQKPATQKPAAATKPAAGAGATASPNGAVATTNAGQPPLQIPQLQGQLQAQQQRQQQLQQGPRYAAGAGSAPGSTVSVSEAGTATSMSFQRETFEYAARGRRDPFVSLLRSGEIRPLFSDLTLVAVLYDPTGRNSVAIMRDRETKDQYRAKVGQTLGRMRVTQIQPKQVVFALEEFGYSRQEVLGLQSDTTKARKK